MPEKNLYFLDFLGRDTDNSVLESEVMEKKLKKRNEILRVLNDHNSPISSEVIASQLASSGLDICQR
ncbi:MAG: hypothetical protein JW745_01635, partial [Sedimentisphaerales bacterium]|nr:hypothetical protein [Sedimentisphaerales bacterium]